MRLLTFSVPLLTIVMLSSTMFDNVMGAYWEKDQKNSILPEAAAIYSELMRKTALKQGRHFSPTTTPTFDFNRAGKAVCAPVQDELL
jgi:hypothetical protein